MSRLDTAPNDLCNLLGNRVAPEKLDILASLSQPTIARRQRKEFVMGKKRYSKMQDSQVVG